MTINKDDALKLKFILDGHSRLEKHIGYHILPEKFNKALKGSIHENRYFFREKERFNYFKSKIDFERKKVIDIGCNIGYFLFSILDVGARKVVGYEGKNTCGDFLRPAIALLDQPEKFIFINEYYRFDSETERYDIGLLLNVLHHLGDDYGNEKISMKDAKVQMLNQLNKLSYNIDTLIFQMGFNWKGDRNSCLFKDGTKKEVINFICKGTDKFWDIIDIGVAVRKERDKIFYEPINESNIERDDSLGEFLNRPIFILQSKYKSENNSTKNTLNF